MIRQRMNVECVDQRLIVEVYIGGLTVEKRVFDDMDDFVAWMTPNVLNGKLTDVPEPPS